MTPPVGIQETAVGEDERKSLVNRLRRLEGQIRGLQSMVETGKSCEDLLMQVLAAKSALNQVGLRVIAQSMKTCLASEGRSRDEIVEEALGVMLKYAGCVG